MLAAVPNRNQSHLMEPHISAYPASRLIGMEQRSVSVKKVRRQEGRVSLVPPAPYVPDVRGAFRTEGGALDRASR